MFTDVYFYRAIIAIKKGNYFAAQTASISSYPDLENLAIMVTDVSGQYLHLQSVP